MTRTREEYEAQIDLIGSRIRERAERRLAQDWHPAMAFEDALNSAADCDSETEATIQMMTLAAASLATGWKHSAAFVRWWNEKFCKAPCDGGFANPAILQLGDGRTGGIIATWSSALSHLQSEKPS